MARNFIVIAAISGFLSVALGAFGAHGLKNIISEAALQTYQTGASYQMSHSLALLMTGVLVYLFPTSRALQISGYAFISGIILFSGSLYLLSFTGVKLLGMIAPLGGSAFMIGWIAMAVGVNKAIKYQA